MSRSPFSSDQRMIRLASQLPEGSALKREILSGLQKSASLSPEEAEKVRAYVVHSIKLAGGKIVRDTPNEVVATFPGQNPDLKSVTFTDFDETKGKFFFTNVDGVKGGNWQVVGWGQELEAPFYLDLFNSNILKKSGLDKSLSYDLESRIKHVRKIPSIEGLKKLPSKPQSGWNTSANSTETTYYLVEGKNLTSDDEMLVEKFLKQKFPRLHPNNRSGDSMYETLGNSIRWDGKSWVVASTSYFTGD